MAAPNAARPLPPSSRREQIADLLREDIVTGRRQAGEQLKQDRLAEEFAVSPAPVREALRQLESEGLAIHQPNRGVFVAEITVDDLIEVLLPVRLIIEQHAARRAASIIGPSEVAALEEIVTGMAERVRAGDLTTVNELDVRFHERTVELGSSVQALQLWRSVQPRIRAQIYRLAPRYANPSEIVTEHQTLLDAITAGDEAEIDRVLEDHVIGSTLRHLEAGER